MMDAPIVVLCFDGLIGDFFKPQLFADNNKEITFMIWSRAAKGIRLFHKYFQVVIYGNFMNNKTNSSWVKEWMKQSGIPYDALYVSRVDNPNATVDYSQIFTDFNFNSHKKIAEKFIFLLSP